jgi:uncharacterized surface protein with fasciclin (FAS1) repeats
MKNAKTVKILAGIAIAALALTGCASTEESAEQIDSSEVEQSNEGGTEGTEGLGTIIDVAAGAGTFNTLAAALTAGGLVEVLQDFGPYTVFAPTDEAFASLPEGVLDALLLPENIAVLQSILTYHIVSGTVLAEDVTTGEVTTFEGSPIAVDTSAGVVLNGTVNVTATDVMASNGVIHVIDSVLLPPGVDLASLQG